MIKLLFAILIILLLPLAAAGFVLVIYMLEKYWMNGVKRNDKRD